MRPIDLARLLGERGERDEARNLLAPVYRGKRLGQCRLDIGNR
jgi:hypothetical protein